MLVSLFLLVIGKLLGFKGSEKTAVSFIWLLTTLKEDPLLPTATVDPAVGVLIILGGIDFGNENSLLSFAKLGKSLLVYRF